VNIVGNITAADMGNYVGITGQGTVAYLCCDTNNSSYITPDTMVNTLMGNGLQSIILYTVQGFCCGLDGDDLALKSIYTMGGRPQALDALNQTKVGAGLVRATISGNSSLGNPDFGDSSGGSNSAVAMSILYSITGLITLLFLIIIATGAIRAHRYPERYGPRSGYGGRPRQSRAKGLARAVLETIPIVKFGDPTPAKPDPALELENQTQVSRPSHDLTEGTRLSSIPEEPQVQKPRGQDARSSEDVPQMHDASVASQASGAASVQNANSLSGIPEESQGCSICTEDFTVGEDVRVLPCNHKFHPPCIDPWLVDVSGTCPLW
jgi:hypothetical protein